MVKAILFDVDGVLIDSMDANSRFYQDIFENAGYARPSKARADKVFGLTLGEGLLVLTGNSKFKTDKILSFIYKTKYHYELTKPTDKKAGSIISKLSRKYRLGIVTGRPDDYVDNINTILKIKKNPFEVIVTANDYSSPKPDSRTSLRGCEKSEIGSTRLRVHWRYEYRRYSRPRRQNEVLMYSKNAPEGSKTMKNRTIRSFGEIPLAVSKI